MIKLSRLTEQLKQSDIRAVTAQCMKVGGINLGQGICDLPTPDPIKQATTQALDNNKTIYSACEGVSKLRKAIAKKCSDYNNIKVDADSQVMVSHGSTGAFVCAVMTLFNPGDEVILFEPFYGYHKNILNLYGVNVKAVALGFDDFTIDFNELKAAINEKTKAIIVCTPCNPCGKVFSREELSTIGDLALENNLTVITDEIYEYITYPGFEHLSLASMPEYFEHTITISGLSKTYNMTGWRLGYVSGPADVIEKMSLVQDLLYVCPATPLQYGAIAAFSLPQSYFDDMKTNYLKKRDIVVDTLRAAGFELTVPQGAYYIMARFNHLAEDGVALANHLLNEAKVVVVPGGSFFADPKSGEKQVRLCYALSEQTMNEAMSSIASVNFG